MFKDQLDKNLFWDIEFSKLDVDARKQYIIERILGRGIWQQFKAAIEYYGKDAVANAAKEARSLDELTHNFAVYILRYQKRNFDVISGNS